MAARPALVDQRHVGIAGTLATTFCIQALGFFSGALTARMLGVEGRGLLAAVVLWSAVIANVGDLGGPAAYVYLSAKGRAPSALSGNALAIALLQSTALT